MNYLLSDLNGIDKNEFSSRLLFDIATARSSAYPLTKFVLDKAEWEKNQKSLVNALRTLKKKGKITFFVCSLDFPKGSTESEYLFNKFPDIAKEALDDKTISYFVKI